MDGGLRRDHGASADLGRVGLPDIVDRTFRLAEIVVLCLRSGQTQRGWHGT